MSIILDIIFSFYSLLIGLLIFEFFSMIYLSFACPDQGTPSDQAQELKIWIIAGGVVLLVLAWRLSTYEDGITPLGGSVVNTPLLSVGRESTGLKLGHSCFL